MRLSAGRALPHDLSSLTCCFVALSLPWSPRNLLSIFGSWVQTKMRKKGNLLFVISLKWVILISQDSASEWNGFLWSKIGSDVNMIKHECLLGCKLETKVIKALGDQMIFIINLWIVVNLTHSRWNNTVDIQVQVNHFISFFVTRNTVTIEYSKENVTLELLACP